MRVGCPHSRDGGALAGEDVRHLIVAQRFAGIVLGLPPHRFIHYLENHVCAYPMERPELSRQTGLAARNPGMHVFGLLIRAARRASPSLEAPL